MDWNELKNKRYHVIVEIEYEGNKVNGYGRYADHLDCFVFHAREKIFYYDPIGRTG